MPYFSNHPYPIKAISSAAQVTPVARVLSTGEYEARISHLEEIVQVLVGLAKQETQNEVPFNDLAGLSQIQSNIANQAPTSTSLSKHKSSQPASVYSILYLNHQLKGYQGDHFSISVAHEASKSTPLDSPSSPHHTSFHTSCMSHLHCPSLGQHGQYEPPDSLPCHLFAFTCYTSHSKLSPPSTFSSISTRHFCKRQH
ncbi:hypothetical protein PTTG_10323 [Puccinia triticina 1-1 BBBD Race 1]|uniref:Uncharacterized protein n=1 Tax=Puccinia triticina (isolate 1-1 / race 1 (BBBD)) TaxID=630390 RepID=A0A180GZV5_PUCT1|nr:hypothetical protein PTTG_10323 [Puccinia triticina 1-1 BBBD Race 1]